jgi:hypothetical protein
MKHTNFNGKVSADFFNSCRKRNTLNRRKQRNKQLPDNELQQLEELVYLSAAHSDQILGLWPSGCTVCNKKPVQAVVHQPLCCSLDGYSSLADGEHMIKLVLAVARLVKELDTDSKIRQAVGIMMPGSYVHDIAVPICSPDGECARSAKKDIKKFLQANMKEIFGTDGNADEGSENAKIEGGNPALETVAQQKAPNYDDWEEEDKDELDSEYEAYFKKKGLHPVNKEEITEEMVPVRLSALVGRPILEPDEAPSPKQLTSLVFTSLWPASVLIGTKPDDDDHRGYQHIAAYHERRILKAADFRCAICPKKVRARTLVHRPISFRRDNTVGPGVNELRQTVFNFFQYVRGKWNDPEAQAVLGGDGVCHIFEFVVPICRRFQTCEATARIAARIFVARHLADGMKPLFEKMMPVSFLFSYVTPDYDCKKPKLAVKKLGFGTMNDDEEIRPLPKNALSIEKLRREIDADEYDWKQAGYDWNQTPNDWSPAGRDTLEQSEPGSEAAILKPGSEAAKKPEAAKEPEAPEKPAGPWKNPGDPDYDDKEYHYVLRAPPGPGHGEVTWGGHPLSAASGRLVQAGFHEMPLIQPRITMDMLKIMEALRKQEEEDKDNA